ncbi:oxidoreductase [bacterium]|nr:oxidoreductase [bacterium]
MLKYGLLINYDFCTGCQTCAVACQQEHDYPAGKCGIKITEYVYEAVKKPVAIDYMPFLTELCDLCASRFKTGEDPACVKHCQSFCMKFGELDKLVKDMEFDSRSVLFTPR